MARKRKRTIVPSRQTLVLFVTGCLLLLGYGALKQHNQYDLSFAQSPTHYRLYDAGSRPMRLRIRRLYVNIPIKPARIESGHWQVFEDSVSHLVTSATPGKNGAIILYGHNKRSMLGPLQWVQVGDRIEIKTIQGVSRIYTVKKIVSVSASDTGVLSSENKEVVIIYTCTGFADSKRFVVKAYPL